MMKKFLVLSLVTSLYAQTITLKNISVQEKAIESGTYAIDSEKSLETRDISLQEKLKNDVSFTQVNDSKGENALSFRGLDFKNTNYIQDGIPLYRSVNGFIDANLNTASNEIHIKDGSGVSSLGVASAGGEVEIISAIPTKELELALSSSFSNNDEFYQAYAGSAQGNLYIQTDASYYHQSDYQLSDNFVSTAVQGKGKRVNSDKDQKSFSLKSGIFLDNNLHLAAKVSVTQAEYGMAPNTYTSISAPVWDAYSRIDEKNLNNFYLFADYVINDLEFNARAYYDTYSDVWAIYDASYLSTSPLTTYDDTRLGAILSSKYTSNEHINTLIFQAEENEHSRLGGGFNKALSVVNSFKLSYLHQWVLNPLWKIEAGLSYSLMQERKASDASATNPSEDKKAFDAQLKTTYTNNESIFYASIAKKSRMPIMSEMFTFFPWESAAPDLKPERSMQYSAGYQYLLGENSDIDLSVYYYDISNLILYRNNVFTNREYAKHYGTELRFNSTHFNKHTLGISYSYAHARDSQKEAIELIPKHQVKVEDSIRLSKNTKVYLSYLFMSSRYSSNTATYTDEQMSLDAYHLIDTQFSYKFTNTLNSRFGAKNILDENYEWRYGYPTQGRTYYISMEYKL
jgi:iron complex outermembrane recepter protein